MTTTPTAVEIWCVDPQWNILMKLAGLIYHISMILGFIIILIKSELAWWRRSLSIKTVRVWCTYSF